MEEIRVLAEMKNISSTLQQMVTYLTAEANGKDDIIKDILRTNHPAFRRFAKLTGTPYRVFFPSLKDLNSWLGARGFKPVSEEAMDTGSFYEWFHSDRKQYIKMTENIFAEDGRLKPYSDEEWKDAWITIGKIPEDDPEDPEDIPF